jgi:hypothetical protein
MSLETMAKRGVLNSYGVRTTTERFGGNTDDDIIKTATWTFTATGAGKATDLPIGSTGLDLIIPAYAKIISATFEVITAFVSTSTTTDLDVGFVKASDGTTEIDLNGLLTAAVLTQTAIGTRGNYYLGAGALITTSIGADAGKLIVTPTADDLLSGKGRIVLRYTKEGV